MNFNDNSAMREALSEGKKGLGFVSPNPPVGCLILDEQGRELSRGYHQKAGHAHAEMEAVNKLKSPNLLKNATVVVTLEPCAFEGKTPSCAKTLASLPIKRVVYGVQDPHEKVSGAGVEILRAAGKEVIAIQDEELRGELLELIEVFSLNQKLQRPFVTLKVATGLDGKMALEDGESQWITGEAARKQGHYFRGIHDAIVVGANTILKDNPRLDCRLSGFEEKDHTLIILNRQNLIHSAKYQVFDIFPSSRIVHINHRQPLKEIVNDLFQRNITSLYLEGGSGVYGSFLRERLVDKVHVFLAPKILGAGKSWSDGVSFSSMNDVFKIKKMKLSQFDNDFLLTGYPNYGE